MATCVPKLTRILVSRDLPKSTEKDQRAWKYVEYCTSAPSKSSHVGLLQHPLSFLLSQQLHIILSALAAPRSTGTAKEKAVSPLKKVAR